MDLQKIKELSFAVMNIYFTLEIFLCNEKVFAFKKITYLNILENEFAKIN